MQYSLATFLKESAAFSFNSSFRGLVARCASKKPCLRLGATLDGSKDPAANPTTYVHKKGWELENATKNNTAAVSLSLFMCVTCVCLCACVCVCQNGAVFPVVSLNTTSKPGTRDKNKNDGEVVSPTARNPSGTLPGSCPQSPEPYDGDPRHKDPQKFLAQRGDDQRGNPSKVCSWT